MILRHSDALYAYILACVRNRVDADDLLQNVAMAVIASESIPQTDDDFRRWSREIARRRILEFQRKRVRRHVVNSELVGRLAEAAAWVDKQSDTLDRRDALLKCVDMLPPNAQQILLQRYSDKANSVETIAARLGRTVESISSYLYRIREKLRVCVERRLAAEGRQ